MTRNKTITALVGGALLLTPVAMAPTATAATVTPTATTPVSAVVIPARRRCGATWGKRFSGRWGPRFKCVRLVRVKRNGNTVVKKVYRARVIRMPITKGSGLGRYAGHRRANRARTRVTIVSYRSAIRVKWRGNTRHGFRKQKWRGWVTYNWNERAWKFTDLRGSRQGRVYHF